MKKRILSIFICVATVLGALGLFTGCSEESDHTESDNKNATTVTLWMTKGEGTTDEAAKLVENAINVITESKLNTHVELHLFDKSEYHDAVLNRVSGIGSLLQSGEEQAGGDEEDSSAATDEVIVDEETGRSHTKYPEVGKTQMDIILINGVDNYRELLDTELYVDGDFETGVLTPIEPSVLISQYVNSYLLSTARDASMIQGGSTGVYAIPNNRDFGTYTYLVLNKTVCDALGYKPEDLASHTVEGSAAGYTTSNEQILKYLRAAHEAYPNMTLVQGTPAKEAVWFTFGDDIPVGRGQFIKAGNHLSTLLEAPPANAFATASLKGYYRIFAQLNSWGQPINENAEVNLDGDYALAYVHGNATSVADVDTDKYYVVVTDAPKKTNENMYSSMYGVTKYSVNAERAGEVVELFNTNKKFRNLMYYGIENVHCMVDENGEYVKLNNDWNMDLYDTGNLYLLERSKSLGDYYYAMSENEWKAGKDLNRDSVEGLLLGFTWAKDSALDTTLASLRTKNAAWDTQLKSSTADTVENLLSNIKDSLDNDSDYMYIVNPEEGVQSVYNQYRAWYTVMNPGQG